MEIINTDPNAATLDEGNEFYVKNALEDYVAHKGKPDEQAFYDRYLERVRRYNELNSVDGKIPPALYTAPYKALRKTKPAHIPGTGDAPVGYASPNNPGYIKPPSIDDPVRPDEPVYRLYNNETSSAKTTQKESYTKSDGSFDYESQKAHLDKLVGIIGAYDKDWYAKYKAYRATKGPIAQELGITRQAQIDWLAANYTDIINGSTGKMEEMPTIIPSQDVDRSLYAPAIEIPSLNINRTATAKKKTYAQKKTEAAKRVVNVDMLDYSAYTGRSEYISRALLGRKAALMYMSRKSTETAGMPVTDISRR